MKSAILILLSITIAFSASSQKFKDYLPSLAFTVLSGGTDGLRDASLFYRMPANGGFWDGRTSWMNKYKDRDYRQGAAYFGSTSFLVFTTDGSHLANMATHQFTGLAMAYLPPDNNKKFGHRFLKILAYNVARQIGHSLVYDGIFRKTYR